MLALVAVAMIASMGPWFAASVLFALGLAAMFFFLRPDPSALALQLAASEAAASHAPAPPARAHPVVCRCRFSAYMPRSASSSSASSARGASGS